jgi:hypothetical protein
MSTSARLLSTMALGVGLLVMNAPASASAIAGPFGDMAQSAEQLAGAPREGAGEYGDCRPGSMSGQVQVICTVEPGGSSSGGQPGTSAEDDSTDQDSTGEG